MTGAEGDSFPAFETWLSDVIEKASGTRRLAFARDTVRQVMNSPRFGEIDLAYELSEEGACALFAAREEIFTASPADLRAYIAVVDSGVLTDGNMDARLIFVIQAIAYWASYREGGSVSDLIRLANTAIEQIDYQVGAPLVDFLDPPEMKAEKDRIAALLES